MTSGTFFPVYVTGLLTISILLCISMLVNHLKNQRKLAQDPTGMLLVQRAPLGLRGLCP
jgi:hypothetical protein